MKVEILNDGEHDLEVRARWDGVDHFVRVPKRAPSPFDAIVLAMAKEIEELREALELDQDDLREAIHELTSLKGDCERGFTIVLEKMLQRGHRVFE